MKLHRLLGIVCAVILLALVTSTAAFAQEQIDTARPASVTVLLTAQDAPVAGVTFHAYRVAELDAGGNTAVTEAFQGYSVSLEESGFQELSQTLAGLVLRDGIAPDMTAVTDGQGTAVLAGSAGLYLILGEPFPLENGTGAVEPALVRLPDWDGGAFQYDITMRPKWEPVEQTVSLTVVKVWEDGGQTDSRPAQIEAQLIDAATGEVYALAVLNPENNWRYTWDNLPEGHSWFAAERQVPEGYTVAVTRDGGRIVLANTLNNAQENPTEPTGGTPSAPVLPQTGTLKWLTPVLAACGMALFLAGWLWRRRDGKD